MHTKSWALATAFALSLSGVSADKPHIYFPRQVQRQFDNTTSPEPTTTRGGLLDPTLGGGDSSKTDAPTETDDDDDGILIGPTGIINLPGLVGDDTSSSAPTRERSATKSASDAKDDKTRGTKTADKPASTSDDTEDEKTSDPTSTKGGLLDPVLDPVLGDKSTTQTRDTRTKETSRTATAEPTATSDEDEESKAPTSTKGGLLDPIETLLEPGASSTAEVDTTTNATEPTQTKDGQSSKPTKDATKAPSTTKGVLDPIETLITDIVDPGTSASSVPYVSQSDSASKPSSTVDNTVSEILPSVTLLPPKPTTTNSVPPDSDTGSGKPTATSTGPLIPTDTTLPPPDTTSTATGGPTGPTDLPGNDTTTDLTPPTGVPTDITTSVPTDVPTNTDGVVSTATSEPTSLPDESTVPVPIGNTTETTAEPPSTSDSTLPTLIPTTKGDEDKPVSTPASSGPEKPTNRPTTSTVEEVPTTSETKDPVTKIEPTATYTNTDDWLPSTIVADPTTFVYTRPTGKPTGTVTQGLPSDIPKKIIPKDPIKDAPEGSILINVGFKYALNYNHVAKNTDAAAQIFQLLPQALSTAGKVKSDKVRVSMLVPYDTRDKWGFVTTLAKVYYPESLLDQLRMDIDDPNSLVYNTKMSVVNDLTADIEPRIDFFGNITGEDDDGTEDKPTDSNKDDDTIDSDDNNGTNGSAKDQATTAGIAVGAFGLAALYGGAMFIVARRYKRKRQGHRRTSSITGSDASSDMQYTRNGSPAMMGGALMSQDTSHYGAAGGRERDSHGSGPSARTANISAPVATENSLGWN